MNTIPHRISHRTLGKTGYSISEIGLGAWQLGGDWGEVSDAQALETLRAAHQSGVNFIDTAMGYGGGRSEKRIGEFLRELDEGDRVYVATKISRGIEPTSSEMERAVSGSIERLGVEALDFVQLHCWPLEQMRGPVWDVLLQLQERGLIRHFGASVETVEEAKFCIQETPCAALQVIFNIFRQKLVDELFPLARQKDVGLIARVPLASGILSGKFGANHRFPPGDHRNYNANGEAFNVGETFAGLPFEVGVEMADKIQSIVGDQTPLSQIALRWILDFPAVSTIIPGAKNPDQARQNAAASGLPPLSTEVHAQLSALYQDEIAAQIRGVY